MPVGIRFFITIKRKNQILQTQKFYSHNIFRFDIPRIAWYNISIVREGTSMKKYYELDEELRKVLDEVRVQMQTTVISYPERNPHDRVWGANNYPGNCSGKVALGFVDKLRADSMFELCAGSGTNYDMCKDYDIGYCGIDLNPNPVRNGIKPMDLTDMTQEFPDEIRTADIIFSHMPYPGINRIKYSNGAWKDTSNLSERDIQNMSFEKGMQEINKAHMRAYLSMKPGAFMVMLVGEIRSNGKFYSMNQALCLPGEFYQSYVKIQHNTWSGRQGRTYGNTQRALTGHEMIAVIRKPGGYEICYVMPRHYELDIRDSKNMATWKDIVTTTLKNIHGNASLNDIYNQLEGHEKTKSNEHWKEKVRQTLQRLAKSGVCKNTSRGYWSLAA